MRHLRHRVHDGRAIDDDPLRRFHHDVGERRNPAAIRRLENQAHQVADRGFLRAIDVSPGDVPQLTVLVFDQHVAVVAEPRQRQVHRAIECFLIVERRGEQRADLRQKRQAIAGRDRLRQGVALALEQFLSNAFGAAAVGDVARDFRGAGHPARRVLDRRQRDRHVEPRPVLAHAFGFELLHAIAGAQAGEHSLLVIDALRRNHQRHRLSDGFRGRVPVQPLGAAVPGGDDAVHVEPENRVVARLDDRGEPPVHDVRVAQRLLLGGDSRGRAFLDGARPPQPIVEPRDDGADDEKAHQGAGRRHVTNGQPLRRHDPARGQARQARRQDTRTEAAVGGRRDDGDEEREKRETFRHPGVQDQPDDHRGDDGDSRGEVGLHAGASEHGLNVSEAERLFEDSNVEVAVFSQHRHTDVERMLLEQQVDWPRTAAQIAQPQIGEKRRQDRAIDRQRGWRSASTDSRRQA